MKKQLLTIFAIALATNLFSQKVTYVTFSSGLNDLAAYSSLYNTQNTRNDSMMVQRYKFADFPSVLTGTKAITSIKGRFNNAGSTGTTAQAELVIYDMDGAGKPNNLLFSTVINVLNSDNGNGSTYKDITTPVTGVNVSSDFFVGVRGLGADVVQFYVGYTGCGCDNAWLYGPTGIGTGDDTWRTLTSRHSSQDLNFYFELNIQSSAGFEENYSTIISMYPNPVKDILTVQTEENIANIKLMNLEGKTILNAKSKQINVASLINGMYILEVENTSGVISTAKFIKE